MKNRLTSLLLLPISVGMLAGCHLEVFRESANEGRDALTKQLVEDNVCKDPLIVNGRTSFEDAVIELSEQPIQIAPLKNIYQNTFFKFTFADGDVAVYSTIANKLLVEKGNYDLSYGYDVCVLVVKQVDSEGKQTFYRVFDQYGNILDDDPTHTFDCAESDRCEFGPYKGEIVLAYEYDDVSYKHHICFIQYNEDNNQIKSKEVDTFAGYNMSYHVGEPLTEVMGTPLDYAQDLSELGLEGYYSNAICLNHSPYTIKKMQIFNSKGELHSTYTLPYYDTMVWIDGTILCQASTPVPSDCEDFTYQNSSNKFRLSSWTVDILSGETTPVEFNYLISGVEDHLYDSDNHIVYSTLSLQEVKNHILLNERQFIVDKEFGIHNNVSDMLITNLTKHGDNYFYYDSYSGIVTVYNYKLDPIGEFKGFPIYNTDLYAVINPETGLYYIVNDSLKVLTSAIYIDVTGQGNYNNVYLSYYGPEGKVIDGLFKYNKDNNTFTSFFTLENASTYFKYTVDDAIVYVQETSTSAMEAYSLFDGTKLNGFVNVDDTSLYTALYKTGSHNDSLFHKVCGNNSAFYIENSTNKLHFFTDAIYGFPSNLF